MKISEDYIIIILKLLLNTYYKTIWFEFLFYLKLD